MGFFEEYGYPVSVKELKQKKRTSKSGIQLLSESEILKEFRELRGPYVHPVKNNLSKMEYKKYIERTNDYYEVKNILTFLRENLTRAANRGTNSEKIDVSLDYVYSVGSSQDFLCALTGTELEFTRGGSNWLGKWCNPNSCTIDRIDSTKGYVKGNIQLITWRANCLKQHLDNEEFIDFCKEVAAWNK